MIDAAGGLEDRPAAHQADHLADLVGGHVVQQDRVGAGLHGKDQLLAVAHLDLDGAIARVGAGPLDRLDDAPCAGDVVLLDQDLIVEPGAVVDAPADAHGVLLQGPPSRGGLAGVEERDAVPRTAAKPAHVSGDSAEPAQEVQDHPLPREQRGEGAVDAQDLATRVDPVALRGPGGAADAGRELGEDRIGEEEPADDGRAAGDDPGASLELRWDARLRGDVAAADVLVEGQANQRRRGCHQLRGHRSAAVAKRSSMP